MSDRKHWRPYLEYLERLADRRDAEGTPAPPDIYEKHDKLENKRSRRPGPRMTTITRLRSPRYAKASGTFKVTR
jgi:hypothetical protein